MARSIGLLARVGVCATLCALAVGCGDSEEAPDAAVRDSGGGARDAPAPTDGGGDDADLDAGPAVAGDDCSRAIDVMSVATIQPDGTLIVSTSNAGAHVDIEVCDPSLGPGVRTSDLVYRYDVPEAGRLHWELDPGSPPALFTIDARSACGEPSSTFYCDECPLRCIYERDVRAGETIFFVVSTIATIGGPEPGTFELRVRLLPFLGAGDVCAPGAMPGERTCAPGLACQDEGGAGPVCGTPACGDGFLGYRFLECDDGNSVSGDGCSSTCEPDDQGGGGATCAEATTLALVRVRLSTDSTTVLASARGVMVPGSDASASCAATAGPEAFYAIDVAAPSRLELGAGGAESVSVVAACGGPELGCAGATPPAISMLTIDRVEPGRYVIVVDRAEPSAATSGDYTLELIATAL